MTDKSWLLNPKAIQAAKACIHIVEQELGVKLKLSHPEFLDMLYDYCELTESEQLLKAFKILIGMAGLDVKKELLKNHNEANAASRVTPINKTDPNISVNNKAMENFEKTLIMEPEQEEDDTEYVSYQGKRYQRWQDEREFKGLYRGQPRYA